MSRQRKGEDENESDLAQRNRLCIVFWSQNQLFID